MPRAEAEPAARQARQRLGNALARVGAGQRAALAEVYQATSAKLFGVCLRILGDRAEAEDALQDTYITVWRNAGAFDPEQASPITWLATLARNRAIDRRRSLGNRTMEDVEAAAEVADPAPDAEAAIGASQERARLTGCIGELEARQADAIRSSFLEGATYAELAERRAVPLGTMKSWVRRGLLQLRECLGR